MTLCFSLPKVSLTFQRFASCCSIVIGHPWTLYSVTKGGPAAKLDPVIKYSMKRAGRLESLGIQRLYVRYGASMCSVRTSNSEHCVADRCTVTKTNGPILPYTGCAKIRTNLGPGRLWRLCIYILTETGQFGSHISGLEAKRWNFSQGLSNRCR